MNKKITIFAILTLSVLLICGSVKAGINQDIAREISQNREINVLNLALLLSKEVRPDIQSDKYRVEIKTMIESLKYEIRKKDDPYHKIGLINEYLYKTKSFKYDLKDPGAKSTKNQFITGYLDAKKGSCITMPLLYYLIGRELNLPVRWVRAPDHFFCRYQVAEKKYINIETTCGGKVAPDSSYIQDFKITGDELNKKVYMQSLGDRECAADLLCITGLYFARKRKYDAALEYLKASATLDSANPATYWFLSLIYKNMGQPKKSAENLKRAKELGFQEAAR